MFPFRFIDVLKDVEELDQDGILEIHIFVTQFFHKFDLRTTVLVCGLVGFTSTAVDDAVLSTSARSTSEETTRVFQCSPA